MMSAAMTTGLIHACLLDGKGGGRILSWDEVQSWSASMGSLWLHFDYTDELARDWILNNSELDALVADALITDETRPRATGIGEGLLIALRGVNLNPGSDPDDMVAVRLWVDNERIISTRKRKLLSINDILSQLEKGKGPESGAEFIIDLADRLVWRMSDTVDMLEDEIDELEGRVLSDSSSSVRFDLAALRKQTIMLRRYLSPQRDALARLMIEKVSWIDDTHRMKLREVSDRLIRHIENIDAVRERAAITQEELISRVSEQLNKRMYVLSVVAAIFLPLGFFTGLLGVNVGGIPGGDNPKAFLVFILLLIVVVIFQVLLFRWKKWL
jgi:zinc transporter